MGGEQNLTHALAENAAAQVSRRSHSLHRDHFPTNVFNRTIKYETIDRSDMLLQHELEQARRQVRTDSLSMSIGELASMYEDGELLINPVFQRLFRWEPHQKSKFIESILLGIPIPPMFLFETDQGSWELVDGLQRISTVFEFMGILRDGKTTRKRSPSSMSATNYLTSFDNVVWERSERLKEVPMEAQNPLPKPIQFEFKRARLDLQILKRPSDVHTKYDLFQRLNSGGTIATPQELRNCAIIMADYEFFNFLQNLADYSPFKEISRITSAGRQIQKPMEFVTRIVTFMTKDFDPSFDVEEFIDRRIIEISQDDERFPSISDTFRGAFDLLLAAAGNDALRRFDAQHERFTGQVGQVALEAVVVGIARNLEEIRKLRDPVDFVQRRIKGFWQEEAVAGFSKPGLSGGKRLESTLPFGTKYFEP